MMKQAVMQAAESGLDMQQRSMFGRPSPDSRSVLSRSMNREKRESMLKKRPQSVDPRSEAD